MNCHISTFVKLNVEHVRLFSFHGTTNRPIFKQPPDLQEYPYPKNPEKYNSIENATSISAEPISVNPVVKMRPHPVAQPH